jgi:endonuclease/exonuclease/phosphatase family metal-dependent hydrolase
LAARPFPRSLWWAAGVLLVVGTAVAGATGYRQQHPQEAPLATAGTGRVLTWNLHYGVSPEGAVDLEDTARTIEAQDPDVILLQEVSRGWVLGGGVDMAGWLAARLDRQVVFAPAADVQFGNAILARRSPTEVRATTLPYGAGPQHRSALSARVDVAGRPVLVTSVHLQHRAANTPTRLLELQTLLAALGPADRGGPARLVGGDLNATPGSRELALVRDAGFVSAVDTAGQPAAVTSPSIDPVRRIDWVLGRGATFRRAEVLTGAQTSDHLPVVAEVRP